MVQDQNHAQSKQLESATERNQQLHDQYTRVDIECRRLAEDLLAANTLVEQLRNECANLRAEKKIWEVRETALTLVHDIQTNLTSTERTNSFD